MQRSFPRRLETALLCSLTLAALALVPASAQAQALIMLLVGDKIVTPKFQPGVTVSFVGSGLWGVNDDMRLSWSIGVYGEIRLTKNLSLQPEFLFKNPGGGRNLSTSTPGYPFEPIGEPTIDKLIRDGLVLREFRSVAFPVVLKHYIKMIGLGAGLQVSAVTRASDTVSDEENGRGLSMTDSIKSSTRGYDIGLVTSVECALSREDPMRALRARLKGTWGLVDTVENNPRDPIRNWALSFGLDIPIGGSKYIKTEADRITAGEAKKGSARATP